MIIMLTIPRDGDGRRRPQNSCTLTTSIPRSGQQVAHVRDDARTPSRGRSSPELVSSSTIGASTVAVTTCCVAGGSDASQHHVSFIVVWCCAALCPRRAGTMRACVVPFVMWCRASSCLAWPGVLRFILRVTYIYIYVYIYIYYIHI